MRRKSNKRESLSRMILAQTGKLAVLTAAILAAAFFLWLLIDQYDSSQQRVKHFTEQESLLEKGQYEAIDAGRWGDWFEILDDTGGVLYTGGNAENTKKERAEDYLYFIPSDAEVTDPDDRVTWLLLPFEQEEGSTCAACRMRGKDQWTTEEVILFDDSGKVLYQTGSGSPRTALSKDAQEALWENEEGFPVKHAFLTEDGERRTLVMHLGGNLAHDETVRSMLRRILACAAGAMILISMLLFGRNLSKKVADPAARLQKAMDGYARGEKITVPDGESPRELAEVIWTFNRMQEALAEKARENEMLQEERQRMLADISHDLKTPITVIQGYADALSDHLIPKEEEQTTLDIIRNRARTLSSLIDSVGTYSKLEHPDFQLKLESADLAETVREYFAGRYAELSRAGYPLLADIPYERMPVRIDREQFPRIFENIISNAQKHTPPGTKIYVCLRKQGKSAVLYIGDAGEGIPKELGEKIFEPFVKADSARTRAEGSGLGLSIAKKLVEMHGGTIHLAEESDLSVLSGVFGEAVGHGTVFVIRLPITEENS